ncbi:HAD-superfamily hydrolase subfamily IA, variant 3 [Hesseltinella vesiculosa]|uniref:HAD-superfamily hydrolase subfamily IA, variant 3 n=1 Tax=Hesseltinella vesiculosa TaxID=101127 RepID=A0A1X2GCV3_9FUNG|nr:HAD-superfamily hydrolase subfamily IA, variant 3 [Hesseltinella vesiculosa]
MSLNTAHIKDIHGFVFDLDGTLIDTTPLVIKYWQRFAAEHGLDPEKILATSHGRRTIETVAEWVPEKATQENVDRMERLLADEDEGVTGKTGRQHGKKQVLPGVKRLLETIPAHRWGICTAGTTYMATARMAQCGLTLPDSLATGDTVKNGKPDPEGYLMVAAGLHVPAEKCVVFEDAPAGVCAGKAAGMTVIACTTTHTADQLKKAGADFIVPFLSEVQVNLTGDGNFEVDVRQLL